MLDQRMIFEIHRLSHEGISLRRISAILGLSRQAVTKYLVDPAPARAIVQRPSKLDPFRSQIARFLETDPEVSGQVILQRIRDLGFDGGYTIVKDYVRKLRAPRQKEAFIRFESAPGEQCQIDWGHFGSIAYDNTTRNLSCMAVIESHSRMLYLEFTHSQGQETLHRCLLNAFRFFGGSPKKLVHDNMKSAVIEREGPLIRFNEAFLSFLRPFRVVPIACNPGKAHEKGKVEKGAIHYIRHNFFPLRSFRNLDDLQVQELAASNQGKNRFPQDERTPPLWETQDKLPAADILGGNGAQGQVLDKGRQHPAPEVGAQPLPLRGRLL